MERLIGGVNYHLSIFESEYMFGLYVYIGSGNYGGNEKRRKPMQMSSMTYMLEDGDIIEDLKIINKNKAFSVSSISLKLVYILTFRHVF